MVQRKPLLARSKRCGYIAYPVDYTTQQTGDPGADLLEGDKVPGFLITREVKPYITSSGIQTKATIPIFGEFHDEILKEIAIERAFKRAGKTLYTIEEEDTEEPDIPERCLIVEQI